MKGRRNLILLVALVAILVAVNLYRRPSSPANLLQPTRAAETRSGRKGPSAIPDAELRLDKLAEPGGARAADIRRNIFEYGSRPVTPTPRLARAQAQSDTPPPPPPPPPPPLRFYGFAEGSGGGPRRVLLTDGDGIFVARQGDTISNRYRVLSVSERALELEDIVGQRRWVISLEMP
ncbi:MAG: hypothetical protein ACRD4D_00370 [Candidatus Acidiferrales bacterium]